MDILGKEAGMKGMDDSSTAVLQELERLVRLMEPREAACYLNIPVLSTLNGPRAAIAKARGRG